MVILSLYTWDFLSLRHVYSHNICPLHTFLSPYVGKNCFLFTALVSIFIKSSHRGTGTPVYFSVALYNHLCFLKTEGVSVVLQVHMKQNFISSSNIK
jgi:hypothetical protein